MTALLVCVSVLCGGFLGIIAGVAIAMAKYESDSTQPLEIKLIIAGDNDD